MLGCLDDPLTDGGFSPSLPVLPVCTNCNYLIYACLPVYQNGTHNYLVGIDQSISVLCFLLQTYFTSNYLRYLLEDG